MYVLSCNIIVLYKEQDMMYELKFDPDEGDGDILPPAWLPN